MLKTVNLLAGQNFALRFHMRSGTYAAAILNHIPALDILFRTRPVRSATNRFKIRVLSLDNRVGRSESIAEGRVLDLARPMTDGIIYTPNIRADTAPCGTVACAHFNIPRNQLPIC